MRLTSLRQEENHLPVNTRYPHTPAGNLPCLLAVRSPASREADDGC